MDYDAVGARRLAMLVLRQNEFAQRNHIDPEREIRSPLLREQVRMAAILAELLLAACEEIERREARGAPIVFTREPESHVVGSTAREAGLTRSHTVGAGWRA